MNRAEVTPSRLYFGGSDVEGWEWRLVARNGFIIAESHQAFTKRSGVFHNAAIVLGLLFRAGEVTAGDGPNGAKFARFVDARYGKVDR